MQLPDFSKVTEELQDKRVIIEMDAWQAFMIVGQIQLALRHPQNTGAASDEIKIVIDAIVNLLAECPETLKVIELGWQEAYDVIDV